MELTQAIVRELLDYNRNTGQLRWKKRERKWFKNDRYWRWWNLRFAGKPAGTLHFSGKKHKRCNGISVLIFGLPYLAHRIIWLYMTGRWPKEQLDHDNRNYLDNRWVNLREATNVENARNRTMQRNNTSGVTGVIKTPSGRYLAGIQVNGRGNYLGTFDTLNEAVAARKRAEREYGFSKGHGRAPMAA